MTYLDFSFGLVVVAALFAASQWILTVQLIASVL